MTTWGLSQRYKPSSIFNSSVIYHINGLKKLHDHVNGEKAFDKIEHSFMIKTLRKKIYKIYQKPKTHFCLM